MKRALPAAVAVLAIVGIAFWLWPANPAAVEPGADGGRSRSREAEAARPAVDAVRATAPAVQPVEEELRRSPVAEGATGFDAGGRSDGGDPRKAMAAWLEANAALAEKRVDAFCDEARAIQRAPPVPPDKRDHDASSYLTVRIDWEDNVRPPGLLHVIELVIVGG